MTEEHDYGAFADLSDAGFEQAIYHVGQPIVIKTFATLEVITDVEHFVNTLEILHRKRNAFVPDVRGLLVTGLQLHQFLAAGFANLRVSTCEFVCFLVNAHDLGQRIALQCSSIQQILPTPNDHAELRTPVTNMIIANHVVPEELRGARQRVAKHGAADVTYMHR